MIERCRNKNAPIYKYYGARGITVCQQWLKFTDFLADMGERPNGKCIGRINNNGNYEPGNCRWETMVEQHNNRRGNHLLTFKGQTQTIAQWSRELGIPSLRQRIHRKWPLERALTYVSNR